MRIAVVTIEGVLSETSYLLSSPPTKLGKDLFDALKGPYRLVMFSNNPEKEMARSWLRKEGFKGWAMLMCYPATTWVGDMTSWKVTQIREMLGDGWDIAMVLDTDRNLQLALLDEGVATLLVSYPTMPHPGRLPETPGPLRPWSEIAANVEEKNLLEQGG